MRYKLLVGLLVPFAAAMSQVISCSSNNDPEAVGSSSQAIVTAATANYSIGGTTLVGFHETSVAFAAGTTSPTGAGRWVVGFNYTGFGSSTTAGWAYSSDATGTSWSIFDIAGAGILGFGDPGNSPYDGQPFGGWRSDPSLTAITDPALSDSGKRLMYTMVACTNGCSATNDVVIALSTDGGGTWGNAAYVNGDHTKGGGVGVDNPWIATNAVSPYHSFVAWTNQENGAWLARVEYSNPTDGGPITFAASNYTQPPLPTGKNVFHPRIAVGQFTDCSSNLHEAVFYAFGTSTTLGRCAFDGGIGSAAQSYYFDVYDVPSNTWYGPFGLYSTPSWPNCVGGGTGTSCTSSPGAPHCASNDPRPHIAVDPLATNGTYYVTHTFPTNRGTRIAIETGSLGCSGTTTPTRHSDPNPCDLGPLGCTTTGPDGGPWIQDEWGPTVATDYNGTTPRVVVTYYGTRDDTNNVNTSLYMTYSEDRGLHWSTPSAITFAKPDAGETVPWDYHLGDWSDYQSLTSSSPDGGFLGAWGGDCRLGPSFCNMYSTVLQ